MSSTVRVCGPPALPNSVLHSWHLCRSASLHAVTRMQRGASRFRPFLPAEGVLQGSCLPFSVSLFSGQPRVAGPGGLQIPLCFCTVLASLSMAFSASPRTASGLCRVFFLSFVACASRLWALFLASPPSSWLFWPAPAGRRTFSLGGRSRLPPCTSVPDTLSCLRSRTAVWTLSRAAASRRAV